MSAGWQLLQLWAAVIVPTLLHFLWQGVFIGAVAAVISMVLRRSAPSVRYAVSLGFFGVMAAAPLVTAGLFLSGVPLAPPVSLSSPYAMPSDTLHWQSQGHTESHSLLETITAWQPVVLLAWLMGVALCSLRLTGGLVWYVWLRRRLEPIPRELAEVVRRLSQRLGLTAHVRIMVSHDVREPLAMRIIQPLIVLPASWLLTAPPLVVEAVLAHELAHIRRHDLWVNLLQRVVETLLFFHPAVWWLSRQIRRERELCCDVLAVAATGRAVEYAQALEAVARFRLAWSSPAMAAGMGGDRMALLDRVRRVLGLETAAETGWWPVGLAGLFLAAVCGAGVFFSTASVQGDEEQPKVSQQESADKDDQDLEALVKNLLEDRDGEEDRPPRREEGDRPRPPREGDRRDPPPRGEGREGDRPRPPREGDRLGEPRREGDRGPQPPREGERGPRDGERRPGDFPRDGERGPQPRGQMPEGDVMRELLMTIRELRQEVQMLREEMRSIRGPRPVDDPRGGADFRPRGDGLPTGAGPGFRRSNADGFPRGDVPREALDRQPARESGLRPESAPRSERREEGNGRPANRVDEAAPRLEGDRKPEEGPKRT